VSPISFDRVADVYDASRAVPPDAEAAIADGIARALGPNAAPARLLDVGVGTGRIAVPVSGRGVRVTGVDVAPAMLAKLAAKRSSVRAAVAAAAKLPFADATFDGALFVHLLHLVADPGAILREAARVVRDGGCVLHGRTDYAGGPRVAVVALVSAVAGELGGGAVDARPWNEGPNAAFARFADEARAIHEEHVLARWSERTTGEDLLAALAGRLFSSTWSIPDRVMPELLARIRPRAAALLGGLDRAVVTDATFTLVVARDVHCADRVR
jgi:ubiquinone/menaquinone biosynthesis C-methylase UbiE